MRLKPIFLLLLCGLLLTGIFSGCTPDSEAPSTEPTDPAAPETIRLDLLTHARYYSGSGKLTCEVAFAYDERGLVSTGTRNDYLNPGTSTQSSYTYNEHGHLISETRIRNGTQAGGEELFSYAYDADGRLTQITGFYGPDSILRLKYDDQGRLSKAVTDSFTGRDWDYYLCEYDDNGNLTKFTQRIPKTEHSTSSHTAMYQFNYDERNTLISMRGARELTREFDEYGNLIRENSFHFSYTSPEGGVCTMQDTTMPDRIYHFDKDRRLTQVRFTDSGDRIEYSYITMDIRPEDMAMSRPFLNRINDFPAMEIYHDKILNYVIPNPTISFFLY